MNIRHAIQTAVSPHSPVKEIAPLSGGCIGQVYRVRLADGRQLVAKADDGPNPRLNIEGDMLRYLAAQSQLPVPAVRYSSPRLLLLDFLPGDSHFSAGAQRHAAELLAALHDVTAPHYGLGQDTLIGGLHQPNPASDAWVPFFRTHRLLYMGKRLITAVYPPPSGSAYSVLSTIWTAGCWNRNGRLCCTVTCGPLTSWPRVTGLPAFSIRPFITAILK